METPTQAGGFGDRRWHPAGGEAEWARATRETVFNSVKRCIAHAVSDDVRDDIPATESGRSDESFREFHICVDAYARGLYVLGQTADGALALILAAARAASDPAEVPPAIRAAIEQWCREAFVAHGGS